MDPQYARGYRELYERHWWWRARESLIVATLRSVTPRHQRRAILDVGCGDGLFFNRLAEFGEVEGVEADASLVDPQGPHAGRIHLAPFDARFQPGRRYGLILMLDVLEHFADPLGGLRHAVDLLEDDGLLVVTVPAFQMLWTAHDQWNHHYTRYTRRTLAQLASQTDLQIRRSRYFFHWLFLAKLAVRLQEALWRGPPRPAAVPPAIVNRSLYALSRFEQWAFQRFPIPVGSSLLIVAGKARPANVLTGATKPPCALARR